jgi:flagellar motor switch protein FliM
MADNIQILNTIWTNASTNYQDRVPQATRDNITAVGNAILNYQAAKNEFLDALVNKIALQLVSSKMAKNKLAKFKQGYDFLWFRHRRNFHQYREIPVL